MADAIFPVGLPRPLADGYGREPQDACSSFQTDAGRTRRRVKSRGLPEIINLAWHLSSAQLDTFTNWLEGDVPSAGHRFAYALSPTDTRSAVFIKPPEIDVLQDGRYAVRASMLLVGDLVSLGVLGTPIPVVFPVRDLAFNLAEAAGQDTFSARVAHLVRAQLAGAESVTSDTFFARLRRVLLAAMDAVETGAQDVFAAVLGHITAGPGDPGAVWPLLKFPATVYAPPSAGALLFDFSGGGTPPELTAPGWPVLQFSATVYAPPVGVLDVQF